MHAAARAEANFIAGLGLLALVAPVAGTLAFATACSRPAGVFQTLYIRRMSRSATFPPIRVAPETKASVEAVLREGESLTQFIENAVCREAEFRAEQNAAVARAKKALRSADRGVGLMTAENFLAGMAQRAKAAQRRIRESAAAKNKRSGR